MDGSMRECLDASVAEALRSRIISRKEHGALIRAAQICASQIDITDEPNASMLSTMLKYIAALGLTPDVGEAARRRASAPKPEAGMDGMRAKFHAVS